MDNMNVPKKEFPKAKLIDRKDITNDLCVIKLDTDPKLEFKPGQYCTLGLNDIERAYSIASAPHEPNLEIFVELVPEPIGALTPLIWKMKIGDEIAIRPRCKGIFVLDRNYFSHLMIATVTGVAPFVSMIRDYLYKGEEGHSFHVLQGASYQNEFTYNEELEELAKKHPETITYVPTVSRPNDPQNASWTGNIDRVNNIVEEYIEQTKLKADTTLVYTCGHPGMIEDIKSRLSGTNYVVKEERFWKQ